MQGSPYLELFKVFGCFKSLNQNIIEISYAKNERFVTKTKCVNSYAISYSLYFSMFSTFLESSFSASNLHDVFQLCEEFSVQLLVDCQTWLDEICRLKLQFEYERQFEIPSK